MNISDLQLTGGSETAWIWPFRYRVISEQFRALTLAQIVFSMEAYVVRQA